MVLLIALSEKLFLSLEKTGKIFEVTLHPRKK